MGTGIAIFNALKASKADITIYIDCLAASTASIIASCGRTVKMSRYARILIHKPTGGVWGNADEIKDYQEQLVRIEETICDIYSRRTGRPVDEIKATYMDGKDHWLSADEALRLGFADEVYDDPPVNAEDIAGMPVDQQCGRFTELYINQHKSRNKMFEKIKKLQQFGDCADEAAMMSRITDISRKAEAYDRIKAENDTLKKENEDFRKKEQEAEDASIAAEVEAAVKDGRIDEGKREHFVKMLHSDEADSARAILKDLKPKRLVKDVIKEKVFVEGNAWAERQEEIRNNYKKN